MNATLGFLRHAAVAKLGDVGDSIIGWYAAHDPETASAADIAQLGERANALAHRIAEIQGKLEHDQTQVTLLTKRLENSKKAAGILGQRLEEAQAKGDTALATQVTASLTPVLNEIEHVGGDDGTGEKSGTLFDAKQVLLTDRDDMDRFREAHTRAMNDWTTARQRLDKARSEMERAEQQRHDAEVRQQQAERDAGLLHSAAAGGIALAAMEKRASDAKTSARAAQLQADSLRQSSGGNVDDIVAQTLGQTQTKSDNALDRLKRLTGA